MGRPGDGRALLKSSCRSRWNCTIGVTVQIRWMGRCAGRLHPPEQRTYPTITVAAFQLAMRLLPAIKRLLDFASDQIEELHAGGFLVMETAKHG